MYLIKIRIQILTKQGKNVKNTNLKQLPQILVLNFGYFYILHTLQNHLAQIVLVMN